ncbi:unnamed protein product [Rhizophagus irregularis]|nr:unnamed protein product [Rhizophagus irregularis]
MPYVHEYFERKPSAWDILDFLDEYDQEPVSQRIGFYLTSLETIINTEEDNSRRKRAQQLYNNYKQGSRLDRVRRQNWEKDHTTCEKAVHSVNFYGDFHKIESINNGSILDTKRKRSQETSKPEKKDHNISDTDESISDDCMELPSVANSVTAKKLSEIGEGIARYSIIFLSECHKNDILRSKFSDYEWRNFKNIFCKKDIEISAKIYKFRKYWLSKWVDNVYQKFLTCFQLSKHVLNDESTSEYQYRSWFVNLLCEDLFLDTNNVIRLLTKH